MDVYWVINFFLFAVLTSVVVRKREVIYFLTAIIVYLTFHHSYGVVPIFTSGSPDSGASSASGLRIGHGMLPQLIGMLFLVSMMFIAVYRGYRSKVGLWVMKPVFPLFSLALLWVMVFVVVLGTDLLTQGAVPTLQTLKDFIAATFMLVLSFALAVYLYSERNIEIERLPWKFLFALIIMVLLIGAYEILTSQAWAGVMLSDGIRSHRASSVLFNPNVLGVWGALIVVFAGYLNIMGRSEHWVSYGLSVLGAAAIFLAASRSSLALCLLMLFFLPLFLKRAGVLFSKGMRPLAFFAGIFCMITFAASFSATLVGQNNISVLSGRFVSLAEVAFHVALSPEDVSSENVSSMDMDSALKGIEGRLGGENADNGYIAMKEGGGLLPMGAWILFVFSAIIMGMRSFWRNPNVLGAFAMTSMIGVAALGMIMRAYQVFPVWGFVSLMMSVYFVWLISNDGDRSCES